MVSPFLKKDIFLLVAIAISYWGNEMFQEQFLWRLSASLSLFLEQKSQKWIFYNMFFNCYISDFSLISLFKKKDSYTFIY